MFSKKATKIDEILLHKVKSTVKISSICVVFLENTNSIAKSLDYGYDFENRIVDC